MLERIKKSFGFGGSAAPVHPGYYDSGYEGHHVSDWKNYGGAYSHNSSGKVTIDKQPDGHRSPNLADAVMMAYAPTRQTARAMFYEGS
ncbi:MAG: hypothetical protein JXQ99_16155 [Hyphomicrobiaceae bacterium]